MGFHMGILNPKVGESLGFHQFHQRNALWDVVGLNMPQLPSGDLIFQYFCSIPIGKMG